LAISEEFIHIGFIFFFACLVASKLDLKSHPSLMWDVNFHVPHPSIFFFEIKDPHKIVLHFLDILAIIADHSGVSGAICQDESFLLVEGYKEMYIADFSLFGATVCQ
jgi:hypothetical protein